MFGGHIVVTHDVKLARKLADRIVFLVDGRVAFFGTIPEMEAALRLIPAQTELLPIQAAGHELLTKRNGEELVRLVVEEFREFTGI